MTTIESTRPGPVSGPGAPAAPAAPAVGDAPVHAAAGKGSFPKGDDWAYTAGIVAILIGAALVCLRFPRRDDEQRLPASYHEGGAS